MAVELTVVLLCRDEVVAEDVLTALTEEYDVVEWTQEEV